MGRIWDLVIVYFGAVALWEVAKNRICLFITVDARFANAEETCRGTLQRNPPCYTVISIGKLSLQRKFAEEVPCDC